MNNIRILARNIADTSTLTADTSPISSSLGVANLIRQTERTRTARFSSASIPTIDARWTSDQQINMVGLTRHNWSTSALWLPKIYAGGSPSALLYTAGGFGVTAFSTAGLDTDIDVYTEADFAGLRNTVKYITLLTTAQQATFTITDGGNPDGYIDQTRLWIGKYFEFFYDPPFGAVQLVPMDSSVGERADDGTHIVDKGWKARRLQIRLEFVRSADVKSLLAILRYLGKDKEFFLSMFPNEGGALELYGQMACRITETNPVDLLATEAQTHRGTITIEET